MSVATLFRSGTSARIVAPKSLPQVKGVVDKLVQDDGIAIVDYLQSARSVQERDYLLGLFVSLYSAYEPSWLRVASVDDPAAMLVRGAWAVRWAWEARTSQVASQVSDDQARVFRERLGIAETCLERVVAIHPSDVTAWGEMLPIAYGGSKTEQHARLVYNNANLYGPTLRSSLGLLTFLTAKWSGSREKMFAFAETSASFPDGHPAHYIVPMAAVEDGLFLNSAGKRNAIEQYADAIDTAANKSIWHPSFLYDAPGITAASAFAYCYAFLEEPAALERILESTGGYLVAAPFQYLTVAQQTGLLSRAKVSLKQ
jgi:hypothetical protein